MKKMKQQTSKDTDELENEEDGEGLFADIGMSQCSDGGSNGDYK